MSKYLCKLRYKLNKLFRGIAGIPIYQKDVGPDGVVLKGDRSYYLAEDITWEPKKSGGPSNPVAGITIPHSNTLLNLNGHSFQQKGKASYTVGIFITNGTIFTDTTTAPIDNIIVSNGTVQNIATAGIFVNKSNKLILEDLNITQNGYSGYILCPCGAHRAGGIVYTSFFLPSPILKNHIWRNIHADSNNTANSGDIVFPLQGADLSVVDQALVENCTFNNNISSGITGLVTGVEFLNNTNIKIINSQADGNSAPLGFANGFSGLMTNFIFENCQSNTNNALSTVEGFSFSPFAYSTSQQPLNGIFSNCAAIGNFISGDGTSASGPGVILDAVGFYISTNTDIGPATGVTFNNCVANSQTSTVTGFIGHNIHAYGFQLDFVQNAQLNNCIACLNTAYQIGNIGDGEGFYIDGFAVTLTNCRAEWNRGLGVSNSEQYDLFPFLSGADYNVNLINCTAIGDPSDPYGCGIYSLAANNTVIDGCIIESNAYDGILIDAVPCPFTANNVIENNKILAPFVQFFGEIGNWAIQDLSAPSSGAPSNNYLNNQAYNYPGNGTYTNYDPGVRAAGNAILNPTNGFIVPWAVPGNPPINVISNISNLDVTDAVCSFLPEANKDSKIKKLSDDPPHQKLVDYTNRNGNSDTKAINVKRLQNIITGCRDCDKKDLKEKNKV